MVCVIADVENVSKEGEEHDGERGEFQLMHVRRWILVITTRD